MMNEDNEDCILPLDKLINYNQQQQVDIQFYEINYSIRQNTGEKENNF